MRAPDNDPGLLAVEDAMCRILEARHPGVTWVSAHRATGAALTRQVTRLALTDEPDDATTGDRSVSASAPRAA